MCGCASVQARAKECMGRNDEVVLRDVRAMAARHAARRGENGSDIQMRMVPTSGNITDLYD